MSHLAKVFYLEAYQKSGLSQSEDDDETIGEFDFWNRSAVDSCARSPGAHFNSFKKSWL